jgi:hypothetical protein
VVGIYVPLESTDIDQEQDLHVEGINPDEA